MIQLFPNLKKLHLMMWFERDKENPKNMLSQILPYVSELNTLWLMIIPDERFNAVDAYTLFLEVVRLEKLSIRTRSELEKLSIRLVNYNLASTELFLNQLATCCSKLRDLYLSK